LNNAIEFIIPDTHLIILMLVSYRVITGNNIIQALRKGDIAEVRRLINLSVKEGGYILLRLTQKDEAGKTVAELAEGVGIKDMLTDNGGNGKQEVK
jgi:hypothetical protein